MTEAQLWRDNQAVENMPLDDIVLAVANIMLLHLKENKIDSRPLRSALANFLGPDAVIKQLAKIKTISKTNDTSDFYLSDSNGYLIRNIDQIKNFDDSIISQSVAKLKEDNKIMQVGRGRGLCFVVLNDSVYSKNNTDTTDEAAKIIKIEDPILVAKSINDLENTENTIHEWEANWNIEPEIDKPIRGGGPNSHVTYIEDVKSSINVIQSFVSDVEQKMVQIDQDNQLRVELADMQTSMRDLKYLNDSLYAQLEESRKKINYLESHIEEIRYSTWS